MEQMDAGWVEARSQSPLPRRCNVMDLKAQVVQSLASAQLSQLMYRIHAESSSPQLNDPSLFSIAGAASPGSTHMQHARGEPPPPPQLRSSVWHASIRLRVEKCLLLSCLRLCSVTNVLGQRKYTC